MFWTFGSIFKQKKIFRNFEIFFEVSISQKISTFRKKVTRQKSLVSVFYLKNVHKNAKKCIFNDFGGHVTKLGEVRAKVSQISLRGGGLSTGKVELPENPLI